MNKPFALLLTGLLGIGLLPLPALAAPEVEVVMQDRLVRVDGDMRAVERDSIGQLITRPGDLVEYTLMATNLGTEAAHGVEIVDPIPDGMRYVAGSARGAGMTVYVSGDGGGSYQLPPLTYRERQADGSLVEKPVPAERYTHVKWVADDPLLPTEALEAVCRMQVVEEEARK